MNANNKEQTQHLCAIDLGSSATRVLVAEILGSGDGPADLRYLGYGEVEAEGWKKGSIVDLDDVAVTVKEAAGQAERMSGITIESALVGVGGPQIQGASASCGLTLSLRPRELTRDDVRRVMETARQVPLAKDREILHLLPEDFTLDAQRGIRDPIGMEGSYLGVKAQVITGSENASSNVVAAVNRAGIVVETTVYEALATAEEVIDDEEREQGVLVVVLGGGSCDLVAYRHGTLHMAAVIPIGGDHFTNDVAMGLHTSVRDGEVLKTSMGSVLTNECKEGTTIEVPRVGDRPPRFLPLRSLCTILEYRAAELCGLIQDELQRFGLHRALGGGIVLCGGGARLGGLCDFAEKYFQAPVRLGLPPRIKNMPESLYSPEHATLLGLALYSQRLWRIRNAAQNRNIGNRWLRLIAGRR